ncbi:hypothetical protein PR202_ga29979 [Eleusine coracana subsp. coracana]|uniref:Protein NEDD1 n=1 Tax=Eleusine coracana subsp. coracana TaxID=191504 RepID=A0AAV5DMJ6_ELECO|nr:hypothetical protein PR202_ga29979 [Eleusine coracana subsp. coracana]
MGFVDPAAPLLATSGGDTVKLFDVTVESGDPCVLAYTSAPGNPVNSVKWNHTIEWAVGLQCSALLGDTVSNADIVLRVLDYSRNSRHLLVTAGDDGSVHLWDTTAKSPKAVTGLCWQRSKPVIVNENSSSEVALLGGSSEESVLMPDPLPSATTPSFPSGAITPNLRSSFTSNSSILEETPYRTRPLSGGPLSKLQAPRGNYNLKDDMDVFSPLVDVQPFTPSSGSLWDEQGSDDTKKYDKPGEKKLSTTRKFPYIEGNNEPHPMSDWRSIANSRQDGTSSMTTTSMPSWKSEPSISSPETPTGTALPDRLNQRQQISRFGVSAFPTGSLALSGLQDSASTASHSLKGNSDLLGAAQSTPAWRPSTYTDRLSSSSVFSEGLASAFGSPKSKKTGVETKDELLSSLLSRQEAATPSSSANLLSNNGVVPPQLPTSGSTDQQVASSFSLQYVQRMLDESLGSVQKSIHEDVRNLHIELLRQFHMQEMEMSGVLNLVLEKLEGLTKEVQQLRRENQQLRHQLL